MNPVIQKLDAVIAQANKISKIAESLKAESDLNHVWNCLDVEAEELEILVSWFEDREELLPAPKSQTEVLECNHCHKIVEALITKQHFKNGQGFHLRADCPECGKFIKFISQS